MEEQGKGVGDGLGEGEEREKQMGDWALEAGKRSGASIRIAQSFGGKLQKRVQQKPIDCNFRRRVQARTSWIAPAPKGLI